MIGLDGQVLVVNIKAGAERACELLRYSEGRRSGCPLSVDRNFYRTYYFSSQVMP